MAWVLVTWKLSLKLSTSRNVKLQPNCLSRLVARASELSTQLGGRAVSLEGVQRAELKYMSKGLDMLKMPTLPSWLSAFTARLEMALAGFCANVASNKATCLAWAAVCLWQRPLGHDHSSRSMAQVIFVLVVLGTGLLSVEAFVAHTGQRSDSWIVKLTNVLSMSQLRHCLPAGERLPPTTVLVALEFAIDDPLSAMCAEIPLVVGVLHDHLLQQQTHKDNKAVHNAHFSGGQAI